MYIKNIVSNIKLWIRYLNRDLGKGNKYTVISPEKIQLFLVNFFFHNCDNEK